MKTTFRSGINSLIALLLGFFGFGCNPACMYGVPRGDIDVSGTVTDKEANLPIENIRITIKGSELPNEPVFPVTYTETDGRYHADNSYNGWPYQQLKIVAEDTTGVYEADSALVDVEFKETRESRNDSWDAGQATVIQDFQLKKK